MAYVDLPTMKKYVGDDLMGSIVTQDDELLQDAIDSAEQEVNRRCRRSFVKEETASTREFECYGNGLLIVDDIWTTEDLEIDGVAYTSSSHSLLPRNGVMDGVSGWPFTHIKSCGFYKGQVYEITAKWGWAEVPPTVVELTKMIAAETYAAKDTPLGVKGENQFGAIRVRERFHIDKKIQLYKRDRLLML